MQSLKFYNDPSKKDLLNFAKVVKTKKLNHEEVASILAAYPMELNVICVPLGGEDGWELKSKHETISSGIAVVFRNGTRPIKLD